MSCQTHMSACAPSLTSRAPDLPAVSSQVRCAHTDLQVPDFSDYRRSATSDPRGRADDTRASRQTFSYIMAGGQRTGCDGMRGPGEFRSSGQGSSRGGVEL